LRSWQLPRFRGTPGEKLWGFGEVYVKLGGAQAMMIRSNSCLCGVAREHHLAGVFIGH
jgi:hypothetical protein